MQQNNVLQFGKVYQEQHEILEAAEKIAPLKDGDGGGTSPPVTEDLKPRVDFLHSAFLWIAGLGVTSFIALVTLMLTLHAGTNSRIDKVNDTLTTMSHEVGVLSASREGTDARLNRMDAKLDRMDAKLDALIGKPAK